MQQSNPPPFNINAQLLGKNVSTSSSVNLNLNTNNQLTQKNIQPPTFNMPKQQPYQYTYHSFNNMQTNSQTNGSNGVNVSQQPNQLNNQNKFVINSNNNGNQISGNGYQYHYSYSNQGTANNNFNNNLGYGYGGYSHTEKSQHMNIQSYANHD